MSPIIDVEPGAWDAASKVMGKTVVDQLTHAVVGLKHSLADTGGMAGTDPGGTAWAGAYDPAASATAEAMTDMTKACYKLAGMLEQTGFNHAVANSASDPTGKTPTPPDTTNYQAPSTLSCDPDPPSAKGGSGHPPKGWGLVEHLVGYVWPNGNQGKLRKASQAWSTAADTLTGGAYDIPEALASIRAQQSPEVDDAVTVCEAMMGHIQDASTVCRELSGACNDLADHIDKAHKEIEHELIVLLEWTIAIEAAGAVASFFSFGAAEIPTQAVEAGRIAATAARIGNIISRLIEFASTVATRISSLLSKIGEILQPVLRILGVGTKEAQATEAAGAAGKEATAVASLKASAETKATDDGLYQAYLQRKAAQGKPPLARDAWQRMVDSLRTNKAVGDAYRDEVASKLGIVNGKDGWMFERGPEDISGLGRRWDMTNESKSQAIEVKSGTTPVQEGLEQLSKDEKALGEGWSITWQLKTDLDPKLMARLQELADNYPGKFHYTVAGR